MLKTSMAICLLALSACQQTASEKCFAELEETASFKSCDDGSCEGTAQGDMLMQNVIACGKADND